MKKIGMTTDHKTLLECSRDEYMALTHLSNALEGFSYFPNFPEPMSKDFEDDFKDAFRAIRLWVTELYRLNDMQKGVDELREALGVKESEKTN